MERILRVLGFVASWTLGGSLVFYLTRTYHLTILYWILSTAVFMRAEGLPLERFGVTLRGAPKSLLIGSLLAVACAASTWLIAYWLGALEILEFTLVRFSTLAGSLAWCLMVSFTEELAFRGYLYTVFAMETGIMGGALISSALFAIMHSFNPGATWISAVNIFVASVFLALLFNLRRSLAAPIAFHAAWNYMLELLGSPVSGLVYGANILKIKLGDPTISGGEFGLEGGLAATFPLVTLLLAMILVLRYVKKSWSV